MKTPATRLEMMYAASLIQNPRIMPREVKADELHSRGQHLVGMFAQRQEAAAAAAGAPDSAEDVAGKSPGVLRAKRAQAQERTGA